jgi:hypothetical protein
MENSEQFIDPTGKRPGGLSAIVSGHTYDPEEWVQCEREEAV